MGKQSKTRIKIDNKPTLSTITWSDVESYMTSLGFRVIEGNGSRVKFYHKDLDRLAHFHRPHPKPQVCKAAINDLREFLESLDL